MLEQGDIELTINVPGTASGRTPRRSSNVRPLFADARAAAATWYERTGIFPANHLVVVRDALLAAQPWLAGELMAMFECARDIGWADLRAEPVLPWERELLG